MHLDRQRATVTATPQRSAWLRTATSAGKWPPLAADADAEVAIIGAGYAGLNAALRLAELGRSAVVLEAEEPGYGGSGRNGGQVIPGLKHDPGELGAMLGQMQGAALARFAGEAAGRTFDLIERHQLRCDAQRSGWLQPALDSRTLDAVARRAQAWSEIAGVPIQLLDRSEIKKATGTDFYAGGWIDPRGGQLQPLSYARELARVADARGVRIHGRSPVASMARDDGIWNVHVNGRALRAPAVLVCTNGYTGRLVPGLDRTLLPASSIMCATKPLPPALRQAIMPAGLPMSDARRLLNYMRFDREGRFMIGARGSFGLHEPDSYFRRLRAAAMKIFPLLKGVEWEDAWGGHFALTVDHLPHIHNPAPGQFAAVGCNGRGVALMSQIGHLLADLATGTLAPGDSPVPLVPLRPLPLHGLRRPALEAAALWYRTLDRFGL